MDKLSNLVTTANQAQLSSLTKQSFILQNGFMSENIGMASKLFRPVYQGDGSGKRGDMKVDWTSTDFRMTRYVRERTAKSIIETENAPLLSYGPGYSKQVTQKNIAMGRLSSFNEYETLTIRGLLELFNTHYSDLKEKIDIDMANFLTFIDQTSYIDNGGLSVDLSGGDGLAPVSSAHTLRYVSTVVNNYGGTGSLGYSNILVARDYFTYGVLDDLGYPDKNCSPNVIITTRTATQRMRVEQLLGSVASNIIYGGDGTISANPNPNAGIKNTIMDGLYLQWLPIDFDIDVTGRPDRTKSYWWGLADIREGKNPLEWFMAMWTAPRVFPMEFRIENFTRLMTGLSIYALMNLNSFKIYWFKATN